MTISNGESFGCCGYWNTCCAAGKGCRYMVDDFEFAVLCSVFKKFYINTNKDFMTAWQAQLDENGEVIRKPRVSHSDTDIILNKLKGNGSVEDIMKLLGL